MNDLQHRSVEGSSRGGTTQRNEGNPSFIDATMALFRQERDNMLYPRKPKEESFSETKSATSKEGAAPAKHIQESEENSPAYIARCNFLLELSPQQKETLIFLVSLGVAQAQIAVRYYCLEGQKIITIAELAKEWGIEGHSPMQCVRQKINALLYFFGWEDSVTEEAKRGAKTIQRLLDFEKRNK